MDVDLPPWEAAASGEQPPVLSVAQLTALIKGTLETAFPSVWVSGEISNLAQPRSGHVYLTLKDDAAQIRAVMWKTTAAKLPFDLEDGQQVICRGDLDVYAPRGSYQLVIRQIEPQGVGALQLALQKLQQKLAAEGVFEPDLKRPLPRFPRRIVVVTSPTGAAIRDFLEVMRRRWRGADVLVIPTRVQGAGAAAEIAAAIKKAAKLQPRPDVLVATRGGGSIEDLWCFNEEPVVRAIAECQIPVISAVGHEIDVTLSDLAADVRALTPSEAAELCVPSQAEVNEALDGYKVRLTQALRQRAQLARRRLDALSERRAFVKPFALIQDAQRALDGWDERLLAAMRRQLQVSQQRVREATARLESLSPLAVLARGYSVTRSVSGAVLRAAEEAAAGEQIETILPSGRLISRVEEVQTESTKKPAKKKA
ncbi:exodeoxyribonuclease VII large subunit [Blastopirellula retiformator]|uniref:Exodeoxyribonuclease 7 large subunit n=1 Tax=Blastopirellula retiformator TaxID=2527970 RepID=A0A5C5V1N0_9BACT|nr:exodeoxyribonuclease VII large subunit [Blastopirellula retiformator]TWT31595.1 Exodeoxyribonuclease 7 large subunit [Blastopirellula retiformator]